MIRGVLIINTSGKPRLVRFYDSHDTNEHGSLIREAWNLISRRNMHMSNFIEGGPLWGGSDTKLIYRNYATLFFIFIVDSSESELGILDLIQTLVETLDKCFKNVCELDLVFHSDKIYHILDELISGGMVLETKSSDIMEALQAQRRLEIMESPVESAKNDVMSFLGELSK